MRHVVFGAFGCGACHNPADRVADIYRSVILTRASQFSVVAFAIFHAGYGPNNYQPFADAMRGLGESMVSPGHGGNPPLASGFSPAGAAGTMRRAPAASER